MLRLGFFPEGEVIRRVLVALAVKHPCPLERSVEVTPRQDAVMMMFVVFLHVEIHRTVADVCIPCIQDLLDRFDLLHDVP